LHKTKKKKKNKNKNKNRINDDDEPACEVCEQIKAQHAIRLRVLNHGHLARFLRVLSVGLLAGVAKRPWLHA
jgi:hypothetical protein